MLILHLSDIHSSRRIASIPGMDPDASVHTRVMRDLGEQVQKLGESERSS